MLRGQGSTTWKKNIGQTSYKLGYLNENISGNYGTHKLYFTSYIFHTGDMKLEANAELRFPIVWKLNGVAIHAPYDTGRAGYYNIPSFWKDGLRLNFGIGYPF